MSLKYLIIGTLPKIIICDAKMSKMSKMTTIIESPQSARY